MKTQNGDLPAMPCSDIAHAKDERGFYTIPMSGLTKREQFAAMAMQGILSCDNSEFSHIAAQRAVECAYALLFELERTK